MLDALRRHWPEYLIEAALLGLFMVSACGFGALLWHPASPVFAALSDGVPRRAAMGLAMGVTAVALIYSPWGRQSGAHMNPATTLMFFRLGKVKPWDAAFYAGAQVAGGLSGVLLSAAVLGSYLAHPGVHYVVTAPGASLGLAFASEVAMAFVMMAMVLTVSNSRFADFTGLGAGLLVASYITWEAPISGMSLNPARTLASAVPAMDFTALWLYLLAPPIGMLLAAEAFTAFRAARACPKYQHAGAKRCIFCQNV